MKKEIKKKKLKDSGKPERPEVIWAEG